MTSYGDRRYTAEEVELTLAGLNCAVLGHKGQTYVYDPATDTICGEDSGTFFTTLVDDRRCTRCIAERRAMDDQLS